MITIALQNVQTISDYKAICDRYEQKIIDEIWEQLPEAEKERINLICSSDLSTIIDLLIDCQNKEQLTGLKSQYDVSLIKQAWMQLKSNNPDEFNRLNSLCKEDIKTCKMCGQPIKWGKKDDKFHPYNLDGSSHIGTCKKGLDILPKEDKPRTPKSTNEMNLVDLNIESQILFNDILDNIENEEKLLEILEIMKTKTDATAFIFDAFDVEIASLKARREAILDKINHQISLMENAQKAISNRLLFWHKEGKVTSTIVGNERKITFRNYPIVDVICNPEILPDEFKTEKTTYTPKKTELKKAIQEGNDLSEYCELKDNFKVVFGYNRQPKTK